MAPTDRGAPSPRASLWLDHGLLDVPFYSALRGREFSDAVEAAEDFVRHGMPERLSPHPLLDFVSLPGEARRAWRQGRVRSLLRQLADEGGRVRPVGPLAGSTDPASARARMLEVASVLGRERDGPAEPAGPAIDWEAAATRPREAGRTSVVLVAGAVGPTVRAARSVLERGADHDLEVWLVDPGSPAHVALGLAAVLGESPAITMVRSGGAVAGTNAAVARTTGDVVALLDSRLVVRRGWLSAVREALAAGDVAAVQPLLLRPDDTIDSAGLLDEGGRAVPVLQGHPKEDALRLQGRPLAALTVHALAVSARDLIGAGGLDQRLEPGIATRDLAARLRGARSGGLRLAASALVTSHHPAAGGQPHHGEWLFTAAGRETGRLRWSLQLPSTAGHWGDDWGDTHFAAALADGLRHHGQDVVTRRRGAHDAGPTHLDDVCVALRGRYPVEPTPGKVNVLWVISHPEDLDPDELAGYDLVCAASRSWSAELSARSGRRVVPLLQATGFEPPADEAAPVVEDPSLLFVGNNPGDRERPLVGQALEAGIGLAVHGRGWDHLPPGVWRGEYVANERLPQLYRRHGIVLADHWPDMARHGFVANRVFDAVASGARVICDDVVGLHEVFDPDEVRVARTAAEVAAAYSELRSAGPRVVAPRPELSFRDRARTLCGLVADL